MRAYTKKFVALSFIGALFAASSALAAGQVQNPEELCKNVGKKGAFQPATATSDQPAPAQNGGQPATAGSLADDKQPEPKAK